MVSNPPPPNATSSTSLIPIGTPLNSTSPAETKESGNATFLPNTLNATQSEEEIPPMAMAIPAITLTRNATYFKTLGVLPSAKELLSTPTSGEGRASVIPAPPISIMRKSTGPKQHLNQHVKSNSTSAALGLGQPSPSSPSSLYNNLSFPHTHLPVRHQSHPPLPQHQQHHQHIYTDANPPLPFDFLPQHQQSSNYMNNQTSHHLTSGHGHTRTSSQSLNDHLEASLIGQNLIGNGLPSPYLQGSDQKTRMNHTPSLPFSLPPSPMQMPPSMQMPMSMSMGLPYNQTTFDVSPVEPVVGDSFDNLFKEALMPTNTQDTLGSQGGFPHSNFQGFQNYGGQLTGLQPLHAYYDQSQQSGNLPPPSPYLYFSSSPLDQFPIHTQPPLLPEGMGETHHLAGDGGLFHLLSSGGVGGTYGENNPTSPQTFFTPSSTDPIQGVFEYASLPRGRGALPSSLASSRSRSARSRSPSPAPSFDSLHSQHSHHSGGGVEEFVYPTASLTIDGYLGVGEKTFSLPRGGRKNAGGGQQGKGGSSTLPRPSMKADPSLTVTPKVVGGSTGGSRKINPCVLHGPSLPPANTPPSGCSARKFQCSRCQCWGCGDNNGRKGDSALIRVLEGKDYLCRTRCSRKQEGEGGVPLG